MVSREDVRVIQVLSWIKDMIESFKKDPHGWDHLRLEVENALESFLRGMGEAFLEELARRRR